MTSFGTVFDLFKDSELHLQDVYGNVEPVCTLVPFEQYKRHVLVYQLRLSPELFVAHLQNLTERKSLITAKEIWTWCVQWKVGADETQQLLTTRHLIKKPRLGAEQSTAYMVQPSRQSAGSMTAGLITVRPCVIPSDLIKQDYMQRILVDIVQVNPSIVPNFVEFLYRWIDYYLGDGKALKAALFGEIPSLWEFERHPRIVLNDIKKKVNSGTGNTIVPNLSAEEVAMNSPTRKMRERPDLAALERKAEESERLKYREVRFGMQPPQLDEPLPPLINIPRDDEERARYYAACFKSRQRAFYMLTDIGVTPQNMRDYVRGQEEKVKDTPFQGGDGLFNYERDAKLTQAVFLESEAHLKKQREIAISNRLAEEAHAIGYSVRPEPSGVPLSPPTPSRAHGQDVASKMMRKIRAAKPEDVNKIQVVPIPLVGKMSSEIFKDATDRETMINSLMSRVVPPPRVPVVYIPGLGTNGSGIGGTSLPTPPTLTPLPRPNLPPPLEQPSLVQANLGQVFGNGIGIPVQRPPTPPPPGGFPAMYLPPGVLPPGMSPPRLPPDFPLTFPSLGSEQLASASGTAPPRPQLGFAAGLLPLGYAQRPPTPGTAPPRPQPGFLPWPAQQPPPAQQESIIYGLESSLNYHIQQQGRHIHLPRPTMQRDATTPLNFASPTNPLSSLPASMLATPPLSASETGIPVQIYFPKVVMPANIIGPGGAKLGDAGDAETDAFLIGYAQPGSGEIKINRAVFLPMGVWENNSEFARGGNAGLLETYIPMKGGRPGGAHKAAYEKLKQAYDFIIRRPADVRERELTKRWRVTKGPMTEIKRGAVWEGWALMVDKEIKMTKQERTGTVVFDPLIGGKDEAYLEKEARRREMEALMEEEEALDESDDD